MRQTKSWWPATLGLALLAYLVLPSLARGAELQDGQLINRNNADQVKDLLPPEIYEHYARGEYENKYLDLKRPGLRSPLHPPPFLRATEANKGKYKVSPEGSIVSADGKPPGFITGFPFPSIDPKDPEVARKIVWNYFYNWWFNGNGHFFNEIVWLNRAGGFDRSITTDSQFIYYQSAPEGQAKDNPLDILLRAKSDVNAPLDLQGTSSLSWRFRDPKARDQNWTYVPALRRVRAVSPTNRSDGFLGSDLAQDDGQYFDGKPEDFEWKLVGETDQLALSDEPSYTGDVELREVPGGGWRIIWDDKPWTGYEDPNWKGLSYAPIHSVLAKRPFYVVEAVPKDRYYLFGKILLRFDKDTYKGYWSSKYDWKGNLLMSYQVQNGAYHTPDDGRNWITAGRSAIQTGENMKLQRATSVKFARGHDNPADYKVPLDQDKFSPDALVRGGK